MLLRLSGRGPLYRQVTDAVRDRIRSGRWAGGTRLPGTRALAGDLGVSRIVVVLAYEQLAAEGYITSRPGSGSRVARQVADQLELPRPPESTPAQTAPLSAYARRARSLDVQRFVPPPAGSPAIDFSYTRTLPDERILQLWRKALARAATKPALGYPDAAGFAPLRKLIADDLRDQRGVVAGPDDVVIVSGSQQALDLVSRLLVDEGTRVAIEDPGYQGSRQAFLAAGARLVPCPVDREGLDVDRCARRLAGARAVYVTPSHQFPTGAVMSVARRLRLLAWAAANGAFVVEDDYESEFRHGVGAISALQGLDGNGRVIYLGTFARSLFPGLRLGYVVVPPGLREHVRALKWLADRGSSPAEQRALAELIESGAYARARRRMGRALARRRDALVSALSDGFDSRDVTWSAATTGTHVFLRFHRLEARRTGALVDRTARLGVRVYSGLPYFLRAPAHAALIAGYATVPEGDIRRGIEQLASAYRQLRRGSARR